MSSVRPTSLRCCDGRSLRSTSVLNPPSSEQRHERGRPSVMCKAGRSVRDAGPGERVSESGACLAKKLLRPCVSA
eukprot:1167005-Rhodomonas_salina.2